MHFRYLSIKWAGRGNSCGCTGADEDTLQTQVATTCCPPTCTEIVLLASQFGYMTTSSDFFLNTHKIQLHVLYKTSYLRNRSAFSLFFISIFLTLCPLYFIKISLNITTKILRANSIQSLESSFLSANFWCKSQEKIV